MTCTTPPKRRRSTSLPLLELSTNIHPTLLSGGNKRIRPTEPPSSIEQDHFRFTTHVIQPLDPCQHSLQTSLEPIASERPYHPPVQPHSYPCFQPDHPSPSLPLTRANLKQLTRDLTPPSQRRESSESQAETMAASKTSSSATDPAIVWMHLNRNYIFDNHARGQALGEGIIKEAAAIVDGYRKSAMTEDEQQDVKTTINLNKVKGETTFLIELWQVLLNKDRLKRPDQTDEEWILSAWVKDGLARAWQSQFDPKWIPQLDPLGDAWEEWKNVPKVKTPYPDILYAYEVSALPATVLDAVQTFQCILSKGMYLPWFSIDAKGAAHAIEEAETQCARAGAAMVYHLREFFDFLAKQLASFDKEQLASMTAAPAANHGSPTSSPAAAMHQSASAPTPAAFKPYADGSAIAFTLAVVPSKAHLFVHFAEQHTPIQTHYHMQDVGSYDFKKLDDLKLLRKHINNILDWGLQERKDDLEMRCEPLHEMVRMAKKGKADGGARK
ncbi:MAG: hypothetical protein Q9188_006119 [Gyalolechia gomerana]